jgi:hypothetical protein
MAVCEWTIVSRLRSVSSRSDAFVVTLKRSHHPFY